MKIQDAVKIFLSEGKGQASNRASPSYTALPFFHRPNFSDAWKTFQERSPLSVDG